MDATLFETEYHYFEQNIEKDINNYLSQKLTRSDIEKELLKKWQGYFKSMTDTQKNKVDRLIIDILWN